jgi:hypothetical protein
MNLELTDNLAAIEAADARRRESRVRSLARRRGCSIHRSRQAWSLDQLGHFKLVDSLGYVVMGQRFEASLEDIEARLR